MSKVMTEMLHEQALGMDSMPVAQVSSVLIDGQISAANATKLEAETLASAAASMAESIRNGDRLYYIAAGSSGLMAAADAMELGGTFGIPEAQVRILMAGGLPTSAHMPGDTEDLADELTAGLADLSARDTVITVSASGSTPFTLEAARRASSIGASIIGIANNANAPLFELCTHSILLATPPEVLSGSTRMGAGTSQKIALNTLSTLMALQLGHIYDGMMVNLRPDNIKLRQRAERMIATIADVSDDVAARALEASEGQVKIACLLAAGAAGSVQASNLLEETQGHLRPALKRVFEDPQTSERKRQRERTN